jgi:hypothetical protein
MNAHYDIESRIDSIFSPQNRADGARCRHEAEAIARPEPSPGNSYKKSATVGARFI